ncbi:AraC family transcriptional regulator [Spirochaeta lutea]|uniref:HTH araC/xylS-type domain-containing protein n=1 Tax=Spirochaeta lutea TaxID=1480694 RepID=A0A098QY71_9SPIO|nr:AraC family transcriptional regulator [Spirochaeta lutea]KGE72649.1 hypothetical protein DC28_06235 [Spirochaeta lutea]
MANPGTYEGNIQQALHYIEERLFSSLTLDEIADKAHMSSFHFHRMFQFVIGDTVKDYITKRRLSELKDEVLNSNINILEIALRCRYNSHEAFTRSFKRCFGISPKAARKNSIILPEYPPFEGRVFTENFSIAPVSGPRFIENPGITLMGISADVELSGYRVSRDIMNIWKLFFSKLPRKTGPSRFYGCCRMEGKTKIHEGEVFNYFAGVDTNEVSDPPNLYTEKTIPPHRYAVFTYHGPVRRIRDAHKFIYANWLPSSNAQIADDFSFECYTKESRPKELDSYSEIWVPVTCHEASMLHG